MGALPAHVDPDLFGSGSAGLGIGVHNARPNPVGPPSAPALNLREWCLVTRRHRCLACFLHTWPADLAEDFCTDNGSVPVSSEPKTVTHSPGHSWIANCSHPWIGRIRILRCGWWLGPLLWLGGRVAVRTEAGARAGRRGVGRSSRRRPFVVRWLASSLADAQGPGPSTTLADSWHGSRLAEDVPAT